ncbi:MAG: hypothetical protein HQ582_01760 [Planctomycetes bacterium]|nr:hypothetical protein [Planctomycetota bacterium]
MRTRPRARLAVGLALLLGATAAYHPLQAEIVDTKLVYDDLRKGLGHQGVTKGSGGAWYVTHNGQLFRYETDDFGVGQGNLIRNEEAFDHADFRGTPFDHLGAPEYHDGNVYTFAKHGAYPPMRLVWYDAGDLSYRGYRDLSIPAAPDGNRYRVSGGPHIAGEHFHCAVAIDAEPEISKKKETKYVAKFRFPSAEFAKFIPLSGRGYFRPQGIDMDADGNFYVVQTGRGVRAYDSSGADRGLLFKHAKGGVHEGCYFDTRQGVLTIAITRDQFYWVTRVSGDDLHRAAWKRPSSDETK